MVQPGRPCADTPRVKFGLPLLAAITGIVLYIAVSVTATAKVVPISEEDALRVAIAFEEKRGLRLEASIASCTPRLVHRRGEVRPDDDSMECNLVLVGDEVGCDVVWVVRGKDGRLVAMRPTTGYIICATS